MKTKISPSIVGIFVLGALALALVALLSFGGVHFFSKPQRFVVYFNESIHGLDLGSPVKFRGVRVGKVVDLAIVYDDASQQSQVAVICEMNRNTIADPNGVPVDLSNREVLQKLIGKGMRAQLGVLGLATGMLYVELDFYDPAEYPVGPPPRQLRYIYIPSVKSAIAEYQASLSEILSKLKQVDFPEISQQLKGLLVDARRQVNKIEVKDLIAEWTKAGQAVNKLAASPELKAAIVDFDEAAKRLNGVLAKVDSQIEPTSANLNQTLAETRRALDSFAATANTLRQFVNAQQNLGADSSLAFQRLAEAAEAVQRLADFLERNPNALISGRKKPE